MGSTQKRGHGEGGIYQRKSDGLWVASVSVGHALTSDGAPQRKRKVIYGKTRKDVSEKLKAILRDQQQGLPVDVGRQTVAAFLNHWLTDEAQPSVRPKTYQSYAQIVRLHLIPTLGHVQLSQLVPQHVQAMMNDKLRAGLAPRTVQYLRAVLRRALGQALKWGLVARNVATLVEPPRSVHHEMRFLSPAQARVLLDTAKGDRLEALYAVALALGLRQGETLGLRWHDVDLEAGTLTVRAALQRLGGVLKLVEPKTDSSRRTLSLPPSIAAALTAHKDRQGFERAKAGAAWIDLGLVFCTPKGTPVDARNLTRRFKALLEIAGLPDMRWHDLRHSCASLLLAQRVPYRVVMETLGHSQISLTMRYSHLVPELRREAADSMERVLTGEM